MEWETVIGLEIHAQLSTKSKIFSSASTQFGQAPNSQACAVDLGLPGVLPVLNVEAVNKAIKFGLAVNAHINQRNIFDRKNYFYPDLPKGYQISQMDLPIVGEGEIEISVGETTKIVGVTRAHLEEDAGKSVHDMFNEFSAIDLNRAGTPLLEIVSEPDMRSAKEAVAYAKKIHALVQYIGICDGNMQEGSFRCDANVSLRPMGQEKLGTRAELKNINSFKFLERAINLEVERQQDILEEGGSVVQETRLYDAVKHETRSMRSKEEANDYRYFPDPDLLPVEITDELMSSIKASLPELPVEKKARFIAELGLNEYDADILTSQKSLADYFEIMLQDNAKNAKLCANWVMGELSASLNKNQLDIEDSPVSAQDLSQLIARIGDDTISGKIAKDVFKAMWSGEGSADDIIESKGLKQVTDMGAIEVIIDEIIANNTPQVEQFKSGNEKILGFFVGQAMKASQGKANPKLLNQLLREKLS
ncbi:glutamyl-tRNA amidotransferase [Candidatus Thioglobus autotrophicus]|jgi:aspartyl-tRNA(Asn)/glutamyl-tRNA(Gln) amidotransferase subunit B|uniref:Aspartyl/glutamyl-tRNA(Asn/Gln) amidotransferase subunit B n=1 Tax=Candidatus Thioglobus autotrophicus TaxID=1705394 RepID=A0A0M4PM60_9GAMM|nr:Asp-tRNA(Asn)/Glu-tRNA(Gln) amidotransferase subunit GatB [Candidatus Thioglobus autotrophicus]ALE51992.1 glutamyl-tRNA amidotransferase [Candidatus Thioglobus autotrophicus]WPE16095.1 Asp-tRNA(Asn)/Glu-tRNA(Gln) amidotransferase subunit GatB [Candidatus Thioglobus autotrophicus]WPE17533.1 Asp-tRNA(Asn)/Glu-tRNA(Gln) amidotransferase subunit GatB [Candidatus Thioglobus autotrophicus]